MSFTELMRGICVTSSRTPLLWLLTSPPYFAGKEYEESLGLNGVPGTYFEFLTLLHDVFSECKRVVEPGGRIAVNVANLEEAVPVARGGCHPNPAGPRIASQR